jgi:hypothetical protein
MAQCLLLYVVDLFSLNLPGKWITAILVVVVVCKDEIDLKAYSVVKMIECLKNVVWLAFASVLFKMSFSFFLSF